MIITRDQDGSNVIYVPGFVLIMDGKSDRADHQLNMKQSGFFTLTDGTFSKS
jgi:hypothetical protein